MELMPNDSSPIQIEFTPRFQRDLRDLAKRYRQVRSDLQPLIEQLEAGELPGDRIAGVNYIVFKVRLRNSSIQKGKSSGYRVIYYVKTVDKIILATIYSKSDLADVDVKVIEDAIAQYEQQAQSPNKTPDEPI
jgi:mRNA-degrading endonuclease RelE of RelBE toxin-antitoxin system